MGENSNIEWTGRQLRVMKSAATKTGCTLDEWLAHRSQGLLWCFSCRAWKSSTDFYVDTSRSSGRAPKCKRCASNASAASRYGTSREEIARLKAEGCAICGRSRALTIDHNHDNEKIRAALCNRCNVGLGQFLDDPDLLRRAAEYLEKHDG